MANWQEKTPEQPPRKKRKVRVFSLILLLILLSILAGFSNNFIPSNSMEPNIRMGDHVATMRAWLAYPGGRMPARGDIIVFQLPKEMDFMGEGEESEASSSDDSGEPKNLATQLKDKLVERQKKGDLLIKRVIGLPGETVIVKGKDVFINGKKLDEPYPKLYGDADGYAQYATEEKPLKIPQGELFLLGDNRKTSEDGRFWGTLKREAIVGKYMFVLYNEGSEGRNTKLAEDQNKSRRE
jgi:signal peptidase I